MADMAEIRYRSPFDLKPVELYKSLEEIADQEHLFGGVTTLQPCGLDGTAACFFPKAIYAALAKQNIRQEDIPSAIHWLVRDNYLIEHKEKEWQRKKQYIISYSTTHKGLAEYHQSKLHI